MLRCLGQSEYGLYQLIGSLAQYLSLLSLGLSGSYIRFFSKYKAEKGDDGVKKLNGIYLSVFLMIACVAILVGLLVMVKLPMFFDKSMTSHELQTGQLMLLLMTVNAAITLPMTIFTSYISANEKFIFQRSIKLAYGIVHPLLCVIALYFGGKATALTFVALICTILMVSSEVLYCVRNLAFRAVFKGMKISDFKEIFSFSIFILLNDIINQVNWSVDKIILGYFSGTVAISVYGIAAQLNTYYLSISTTISSVYAPQINRITAGAESEEKKNVKLNQIFSNVGRIQCMIIALVISGYIFFGKQFICLWAGIEYKESYYVGLWLMVPAAIPLLQNIGIEIQRARNKHRTRTIVYMLIAIGNVMLSIPLCKIFGAVGCAMGTAISLVLGNILFMNWYYQNRLDVDIFGFWKKILKMVPAFIMPCIVGIFIMKFVNIESYIKLAAFILIYTVVYCISVYCIAMNLQEKKRVCSFVAKMLRRRG
jgi:O-antigen/teichoic acid export membrane protein